MRLAALALAASTLAAPALAQNRPVTGIPDQIPAPMVRAIQAMVSPATLKELRSRATGGNTMENVLETTLLNNLQLIDPGNSPGGGGGCGRPATQSLPLRSQDANGGKIAALSG